MEISVPKAKFEEMRLNICGQQIINGYVQNTVLLAGLEYIVTTGSGNNDGSTVHVIAYRVAHLSKYKGSLKPLEYRMHFLAIDTGRRARGYNGMLIKHGQRKLVVVGGEVRFYPSDEGTQLGLFKIG